jgi:hypothetical protein
MPLFPLLLALQTPAKIAPIEKGMNASTELRLASWKPSRIDRATPKAAIWIKTAEVAGKWGNSSGLDSTHIALVLTGGKSYQVNFRTHGCLGHWVLHRTAKYDDGTIVFDKPVEGYSDGVYDRLYTVKIDGQVRLIAPKNLPSAGDRQKASPDWLWMRSLGKLPAR